MDSPRTRRRVSTNADETPNADPGTAAGGAGASNDDEHQLRNQLLDAALVCYRRQGVANTSVHHIAHEAKMARPTVYRHFSSHRVILRQAIHRAIQGYWARLYDELRDVDNLPDYVVAGLLHAIRQLRNDPALNFMLSPEVVATVGELLLSREYLIDLAELMKPAYDKLTRDREDLKPGLDLLALCEWSTRLALSYIRTPPAAGEEQLESQLRLLVCAVAGETSPR